MSREGEEKKGAGVEERKGRKEGDEDCGSEVEDKDGAAKKERELGIKLLDLLGDTKRHLDHLIISDSDAKDKQVNRVVRSLMRAFPLPLAFFTSVTDETSHAQKKRTFLARTGSTSRRTKTSRSSSVCRSPPSLPSPTDASPRADLRSLQAKLAELERLAQRAVGSSQDAQESKPSGSGADQEKRGEEVQNESGSAEGGKSGKEKDVRGQAEERNENTKGKDPEGAESENSWVGT